MSKLLLDEEPLLIMPTFAVKVGLNEAIILQQVHYWLKINKQTNKNYIDNRYWTYNTYEEWQKQFPFWSISTIKRSIYKLEKLNLIISSTKFNKLSIDKTKWYTINYETLDKIENEPTCQIDTTSVQIATSQKEMQDSSKRNDGRVKKNKALPETTTKTKTKTSNYVQKGIKSSTFNDFPQRTYDFKELENKFFGWEE